jgi:hypothetical protein
MAMDPTPGMALLGTGTRWSKIEASQKRHIAFHWYYLTGCQQAGLAPNICFCFLIAFEYVGEVMLCVPVPGSAEHGAISDVGGGEWGISDDCFSGRVSIPLPSRPTSVFFVSRARQSQERSQGLNDDGSVTIYEREFLIKANLLCIESAYYPGSLAPETTEIVDDSILDLPIHMAQTIKKEPIKFREGTIGGRRQSKRSFWEEIYLIYMKKAVTSGSTKISQTVNSDHYGHTCMVLSLYSAMHCVAWNYHFPTVIEMLLWRGVCLSLICVPFIPALFKYFFKLPYINKVEQNTVDRLTHFINNLTSVYIFLCRLYIMVEPFVSLRLLPADAYRTVAWENIWPHL